MLRNSCIAKDLSLTALLTKFSDLVVVQYGMNLVKTPNGDILRVVTQEEVTHRCGKVTSTLILQNVKFEVTVVAQAPISDVLKSFNMESA